VPDRWAVSPTPMSLAAAARSFSAAISIRRPRSVVLTHGPPQHLLHCGDALVKVEDLRLDHLAAGEGE
jgi:hypothetical protein